MDEATYQAMLKLAKNLRQLCLEFPAHDLLAYQEKHHPEDHRDALFALSLHCEAQD
jgi:hypothetical protein